MIVHILDEKKCVYTTASFGGVLLGTLLASSMTESLVWGVVLVLLGYAWSQLFAYAICRYVRACCFGKRGSTPSASSTLDPSCRAGASPMTGEIGHRPGEADMGQSTSDAEE